MIIKRILVWSMVRKGMNYRIVGIIILLKALQAIRIKNKKGDILRIMGVETKATK